MDRNPKRGMARTQSEIPLGRMHAGADFSVLRLLRSHVRRAVSRLVATGAPIVGRVSLNRGWQPLYGLSVRYWCGGGLSDLRFDSGRTARLGTRHLAHVSAGFVSSALTRALPQTPK